MSTIRNYTDDYYTEGIMQKLMTQIRNYTEDQLKLLLNDDLRINSIVDESPQVSVLPREKEGKLAQNKLIAENNLSLEPKLNNAVERLQKAHAEAIKTKQDVLELKEKLDSISDSRSLDTISALLQASTREAEDEGEKIAEDFLNGTLDVEDFVRNFTTKRSEANLKKLKYENLNKILREQQYEKKYPHNRNSYY